MDKEKLIELLRELSDEKLQMIVRSSLENVLAYLVLPSEDEYYPS